MKRAGNRISNSDVWGWPQDAGMRMQSILDADEYFHSEDAEVVSVHRFARRIIADYMPPVTAGVP